MYKIKLKNKKYLSDNCSYADDLFDFNIKLVNINSDMKITR